MAKYRAIPNEIDASAPVFSQYPIVSSTFGYACRVSKARSAIEHFHPFQSSLSFPLLPTFLRVPFQHANTERGLHRRSIRPNEARISASVFIESINEAGKNLPPRTEVRVMRKTRRVGANSSSTTSRLPHYHKWIIQPFPPEMLAKAFPTKIPKFPSYFLTVAQRFPKRDQTTPRRAFPDSFIFLRNNRLQGIRC